MGDREDFFADYPWPERFRCCDQTYSKEYDYTEDELTNMAHELVHERKNYRFLDKTDLYFHFKKVGTLTVDLGKVYDALVEDQHRINEWSDAEFDGKGPDLLEVKIQI